MVQRRDFVKGLGATVAHGVAPGSAFAAGPDTPDATKNPKGVDNKSKVPPPGGGLTSNSNYFLYSDGNPITGLSVTVEVTKDIVAVNGINAQLNAYSDASANATWLQYCFGFHTSSN